MIDSHTPSKVTQVYLCTPSAVDTLPYVPAPPAEADIVLVAVPTALPGRAGGGSGVAELLAPPLKELVVLLGVSVAAMPVGPCRRRF